MWSYLCTSTGAQTGFWTQWKSAATIITDISLTNDEKIVASQSFLQKAQSDKDSTNLLCGYGLLFHAYMNIQDYANANLSLKQAEELASMSNDASQLGWVKHKQAVLAIRLITFEKAKLYCLSSIEYCTIGKDSLCLALSHEQAGSIYGGLDQFDSAQIHFEFAQTLLTKFASENHIAAFNNNYANMQSLTGHPEKAIPYLNKAIDYYRKTGRTKTQLKVTNNLGRAHLEHGDYSKARLIYEQCVKLNKENKYSDNLISNYNGLFDLAYKTDKMKEAFLYLDTYYELKDSLVGAQTQHEIAELESNYTNQKLELELAHEKVSVQVIKRKLERRNSILFVVFLLLLSMFALLRWRAKIARQQLTGNKQHLNSLTKVILDKNEALIELQEQVLKQKESMDNDNQTEADLNLFDMRILTDSDWKEFLSSFEKAYPKYVQQLRQTYSDITESEERLFLFIKLKLGRKEIATILGINPESVKKTRSRLRKRLGLATEIKLDDFISQF